MSSILKALRKLEEEKARREPGSVNIAHDILRPRRRQESSSPGRRALLMGVGVAVVLGLLVGALGWLLVLGRPGPAPVESETPSAVAPSPTDLATAGPTSREAAPPASPSVAAEPDALSAGGAGERGGTASPAPDPSPAQGPHSAHLPELAASASTEDRRASGNGEAEGVGGSAAHGGKDAGGAGEVPAKEVPVAEPPGTGLILNGIAWQAERDRRMAIINDLPVMEGTDIDGARVVEILPARVRLEKNGVSFVLELE